jgi:hypothetical protein
MQGNKYRLLTMESSTEFNHQPTKLPYFPTPHKQSSSHSLHPQTTKVASLKNNLGGFPNTSFSNRKSLTKEIMPSIHQNENVISKNLLRNSKDNSLRTNDTSSDSRDLMYYGRSDKEEVKTKDEYFTYNNNYMGSTSMSTKHNKPYRSVLTKASVDNNNNTNNKYNSVDTPSTNYKPVPVKAFENESKTNSVEHINISTLLSKQHIPLNINVLQEKFTNYENSKYSSISTSGVKAYCANTHQGIVR